MKFKIKTLRAGDLGKSIIGDPNSNASFVSNLSDADPESVTFYSGDQLEITREITCAILLANTSLRETILDFKARAIVFSEDPMRDFVRLVNENYKNTFTGHSPKAIRSDAKIAQNAYIEQNVSIGSASEVFPFVSIFDGSSLGSNCRIQSFTAIGAVGLAYTQENGIYTERFTHLGGVELGDDVDIGANTTIVRGILQDTKIGSGTKIGNQVNIGHNVTIGSNCFISSGATLCGSVIVEDGCWIAPGAKILNKVTIRQNTQIGIGAVVNKDTESDSVYLGYPARRLGARKN